MPAAVITTYISELPGRPELQPLERREPEQTELERPRCEGLLVLGLPSDAFVEARRS